MASLKRPKIVKEIKLIIKNFSTWKTSRPDDFMGKFYQSFKEKQTLILLKIFQKIQKEESLPKSFCEASVILITKPAKDTTRK